MFCKKKYLDLVALQLANDGYMPIYLSSRYNGWGIKKKMTITKTTTTKTATTTITKVQKAKMIYKRTSKKLGALCMLHERNSKIDKRWMIKWMIVLCVYRGDENTMRGVAKISSNPPCRLNDQYYSNFQDSSWQLIPIVVPLSRLFFFNSI